MHNAKRTISLLLVLCMLLSVLPVGAQAITITEKPADGTTVGQPFAPGTGGSQNFRIPGIVTLDNGTIIAACDARWNHAGDGAGLDTIVSVSTDNGENWTYTFANYLGDNGDVKNVLSTCIIDPGIGTDGTTAYLIADLWPAGIALNTSKYSPVAGQNGFTDDGHLMLRDATKDTVQIGASGYNTMAAYAVYGYYLDLENLTLHANDGTPVPGYTVDAYFNIKSDDGNVNTNLFFSDSPYQPYPTDYLYMTTSTDGLEWSEPELLNLQEKAEQTLLVGPGNGTYDAENDRMIFTAYDHTSGYERACLIWMDSEGNWHRSEDATGSTWSSEASSVVLEDGTVRVFYRDGYTYLRYTDYVFDANVNNYVVAQREVNTSAAKRERNQLTSILYSEKIDGKEAILVSCASNPAARSNGHLYVFLVEDDKSMTLAYDYDIFPGVDEYYAYNCLTELSDGTVALLYENQASAITYHVIDMADVLVRDNDPSLSFETVDLLVGESQTFTDNTGCYADPDLSELDTSVATVKVVGEETTTNAAKVLGTGAAIDLDDCQYTFTADGTYFNVSAQAGDTTVYLNHFSTTNNNIPNVTAPAGKIAVLDGTVEDMFRLQAQVIAGTGSGAARTLHFHAESETPYWNRCGNDTSYKCQEYLYRKAAAGEVSSTEIPGYVRLTSVEEVVDGGKYLIAAKNDAGNWYVLHPSTSGSMLDHMAQIMGSSTVGKTEITFTGVGGGYTEVQIGHTVYKVTVHAITDVPVEVIVGTTVTVTEPNGSFDEADTSKLDTSIATVEVTGIDGTAANGLSLAPVSELADGTYVIVNTRANKLVTNAPATAAAAAGAGSGLNMAGSTRDEIDAIAVWTITAVDGGYTIQDQDGKYMTIGSKTAGITDSANTISMTYRNGTWTIAQNGAYLNHFGGGSSTCAAGWQDATAAGDAGSQFDIYSYSAEPATASTKVAITGVKVGTTEVLVGYTRYLISVVEEAVHEHSFGDWTVTKEPTCTEKGEETGSCSCGETETREIPALGHDYQVFEVVPPTCTKTGYTVYKCTRCGRSYKDDPVEPEHKFDSFVVTPPTCQDLGYTTYICSVCGFQYVDEASWTDRVDHDHVNGECTFCGDLLDATFTDVPAGSYCFDAVEWAVEKGVTNGVSNTLFDPLGVCKRAHVVTFLWRAAGSPEPATTESKFVDIEKGSFYEKAVLWAVENGITTGVDDTHFAPNQKCTRAQVVTFLWRAEGKQKPETQVNPFTDVKASDYCYEAVLWAVENNITNGMGAGTFAPNALCNRAQVVTFLYRAE